MNARQKRKRRKNQTKKLNNGRNATGKNSSGIRTGENAPIAENADSETITNKKTYESARRRWLIVLIMSTGFPSILSFWLDMHFRTGLFNGLIGNGNLVLSMFALSLSTLYEIVEEKKGQDDRFMGAFALCIFDILFLFATYVEVSLYYRNPHSVGSKYLFLWFVLDSEAVYGLIFLTLTLGCTVLTCFACLNGLKITYKTSNPISLGREVN